jgi:hypothetical protein
MKIDSILRFSIIDIKTPFRWFNSPFSFLSFTAQLARVPLLRDRSSERVPGISAFESRNSLTRVTDAR